jgi:hypothetical protein
MNDMRAVDKVYHMSAATTIRRARISHDLFRDFSTGVDRLVKTLGDATEEELWKHILQPLKRYRFSLASTPLSFNTPSLSIAPFIETARAQLPSCQNAHPWAAQRLANLLEIAAALQSCPDNPILNFLSEQYPEGATGGAVLLKDSRLIKLTQRSLRSYPATRLLAVITAGQLKKETCYSQLFIVGAARWFPEYIITAPRADDLTIIRYSWIRDATPSRFRFIESWQSQAPPPSTNADAESGEEETQGVEADDLLPRIDWTAIQKHILRHNEVAFDDVPAKIAVLEGDYGVFLEDDESATILTLDLEADEPTERVRRISTGAILPGMFVLLRTTGGGDYIVPIADGLMGTSAARLRSCQEDWKTRLRTIVAQSSLFEVSIRLIELGSIRANEINVRNWMSRRNIKTYDPKDFAAIMQFIGLRDRTEEYWNAMSAISQAHQRAGQQIRRVLLRRLREIDLTNLERDGRLDISLPHAESGALTAFRVIDIATADQLIAATKLNHPFPLGEADAPYSPS